MPRGSGSPLWRSFYFPLLEPISELAEIVSSPEDAVRAVAACEGSAAGRLACAERSVELSRRMRWVNRSLVEAYLASILGAVSLAFARDHPIMSGACATH